MGEKRQKIEASTQAYLPIKEIKEGTVVMRDGSLRAVVIVSTVNFALKSEDEKASIVYSYQNFLNSLSFPLQILSTSRKLDLTAYLTNVSNLAESHDNPLLKVQTQEYVSFIKELLEYANIMEKRFFVVVPYYPGGAEVVGTAFKKQQVAVGGFDQHKKELLARVEEVINGLAAVGLRCVSLGTEDLLELYYTSYNPDVSRNQKIDLEGKDIGVDIVKTTTGEGGVNEPI